MGLHLLSPSPSTVVDINLFGFSEKWLEGLLRITSAILGGVSKELEICDKYGLNKSCKNACVVVVVRSTGQIVKVKHLSCTTAEGHLPCFINRPCTALFFSSPSQVQDGVQRG